MSNTALVLSREKVNPSKVRSFQELGFTFDSSNNGNYSIGLPKGWSTIPGQSSSMILDEKNRRRGLSSVGFFSIKNDLKLLTRYRVESKRIVNDKFSPILIYVCDSDGNQIKGIGLCGTYNSEDYTRLVEQAENYLDENFPNWRDPSAYWD